MNYGILLATAGFIAGNYTYAWVRKTPIGLAHDRSFFQCVLGLYLSITY
mgnify:CR=1 FL=1